MTPDPMPITLVMLKIYLEYMGVENVDYVKTFYYLTDENEQIQQIIVWVDLDGNEHEFTYVNPFPEQTA